jgi:pimeloyl-ACP methyl ester carboxylesterase
MTELTSPDGGDDASDAVLAAPVRIDDAALDDLRARLERTRFPDVETVQDWSQGLPLAYAEQLRRSWLDDYDWRQLEARLNELGPSRTTIDGVGIHLLHQRSPHPDAIPLILTHGWPGSVVEFLGVIDALTNPTAHGGTEQDAFHVVVPSLPGYGFSDAPTTTGWGRDRIADAWAELMTRLGYERFAAQGGDWGAMITAALAAQHPDRLVGVHVTLAIVVPPAETLGDLTPEEQSTLDGFAHYQRWDGGYSAQQSSRPQTLGYSLADSPMGQAAWIIEKFWSWTDHDGHPEHAIDRTTLLDNVMLYWLTNTATSSARLYWESFHDLDVRPVTVPSGVSVYPKEIFRPSRRWLESRFTDLRHYGRPERGGHFAAMEQPTSFVDEVRATFSSMR